jgi:acyl transferase domain-containing protein
VLLSARSSDELEIYKKSLRRKLIEVNESSFNDIAFTLRDCRKAFKKRCGCVARSKEELIEKLKLENANHGRATGKKIVFLFPGQGAQYAGMATPLYGNCPTFSHWIDQGLAVAQPLFKEPLSHFLLDKGNDTLFRDARYSDPLLFIFEFALAQELLELGSRSCWNWALSRIGSAVMGWVNMWLRV